MAERVRPSDHTGMSAAFALQAPTRLRHNPAQLFDSFLLNIDFRSAGGEEASAVGGGDSIPEALPRHGTLFPSGSSGNSSAGTTSTATEPV